MTGYQTKTKNTKTYLREAFFFAFRRKAYQSSDRLGLDEEGRYF